MFALWSSPNHIPIKYRDLIEQTSHLRPISLNLIPSPHLLVLATNERFLPAGGTSKSYFSQWWEALVITNAGTLRSLVANTSRCGESIISRLKYIEKARLEKQDTYVTYTLNVGAFEGKGPMNLCRKWLFQARNGSPSGVEARMWAAHVASCHWLPSLIHTLTGPAKTKGKLPPSVLPFGPSSSRGRRSSSLRIKILEELWKNLDAIEFGHCRWTKDDGGGDGDGELHNVGICLRCCFGASSSCH